MKLGICEVVVYDQHRFSNTELENLATDTLAINPLGKIYNEIKVVPTIDMTSYGKNIYGIIHDMLREPEWRDTYREKHGVDVIAYIAYDDQFDKSGDGVKDAGWSFGDSGTYGKGPVFVYGTRPRLQTVAHEIGHLFGLDHEQRGEPDIMSEPIDNNEIATFSPINKRHIEYVVAIQNGSTERKHKRYGEAMEEGADYAITRLLEKGEFKEGMIKRSLKRLHLMHS